MFTINLQSIAGNLRIVPMISLRFLFQLACAPIACTFLMGCRSTGPDRLPAEPEQVQTLSLMLPAKIKIQPFTKIKSFNDDETPDGISAVVRPVDSFGDPVKAAGLFYFELWSYREASGDHKGERLEFWEKRIDTAADIKLYWTQAQMYDFQLGWTQGTGKIKPGSKYVFTATYRTPWDTTIQDEYVLQFHFGGQPVTSGTPELKIGQK